MQIARFLATAEDTVALGAALGRALEAGTTVYLIGELGAGKTTLARGILRGLGFQGRVKSPTFALVEVYKFSSLYLYHFDFYRFEHPQELELTGFREHFNEHSICLVEWPQKASGLPAADVCIEMHLAGEGRTVELRADTEVGRLCLTRLQQSGGA